MPFSLPSYLLGVGTVVGALAFGFGGGVLLTKTAMKDIPVAETRVERVKRADSSSAPPRPVETVDTKAMPAPPTPAQPAPPAAPASPVRRGGAAVQFARHTAVRPLARVLADRSRGLTARPLLPLLVRFSRRGRLSCGCPGLRVEFAGHFLRGEADIEQGAAAFLHQRAGTLVEALRQFANRLHLLEQFVRLSIHEAGHDVADLCHGAVEAFEGAIGLADDAVDRVALADQRCRRIGLEIQQRVLQHRPIADEQP